VRAEKFRIDCSSVHRTKSDFAFAAARAMTAAQPSAAAAFSFRPGRRKGQAASDAAKPACGPRCNAQRELRNIAANSEIAGMRTP
jgi:hypothetical protein